MKSLVGQELLQADLDCVFTRLEDSWRRLRGTRLLVTGGTGFIGRWMLEGLREADTPLGLQTHLNFFNGVEVGGSPKSNLTFPNFKKVSQAFGFSYLRVASHEELRRRSLRLWQRTGQSSARSSLRKTHPSRPRSTPTGASPRRPWRTCLRSCRVRCSARTCSWN